MGNTAIHKISFLLGLVTAILMIRCEREDISRNASFHNPLANPEDGPPAGNPDGRYPVPLEAGPEDVSGPDQVIGDGTPGSCTCDAFVNAVAKGGRIVFNCGPDPVTIPLDKPAKVPGFSPNIHAQ